MLSSVIENVRPVTASLTEMLAELGFDTGRITNELDLTIDWFDQWTNPSDALFTCGTCTRRG